MEILKILKILICSTNQHKKYDILHVQHFFLDSKLTLDRSHRDYRALVNKSAVIAVSGGGDGGERSQSFNKSAVRETKIFNKRSLVMLAARRTRGALRCDLATVHLRIEFLKFSKHYNVVHMEIFRSCS